VVVTGFFVDVDKGFDEVGFTGFLVVTNGFLVVAEIGFTGFLVVVIGFGFSVVVFLGTVVLFVVEVSFAGVGVVEEGLLLS